MQFLVRSKGVEMRILSVILLILTLGLVGCGDKSKAQKPNLTSEQREIAELLEKIKTETGVNGDTPKDIWKAINSKYNDNTARDSIIKQHLEWTLEFIVGAGVELSSKNTAKAKKQIELARVNLVEATWFLNSRKVEYNPEVTRLLREYWQVKKRLEKYEKEYVEPLIEDKYKKAVELEELYFSSGAISISYGRLDNAIFYLTKAVETVRMAEIVGDFERFQTWQKGATENPPNYDGWTTCLGITTKTCFDNNPFLAVNVVTEYSDKTGGKQLLMWWSYKRSKDKFEMHGSTKSLRIEVVNYRFYKRVDNEWILLDTRTFIRSDIPKNQEIPLFYEDSKFGKEYLSFKTKMGEKEIKIPTITFKE